MLENFASILFTNSPSGSGNQTKQIAKAAGALEDGRPDVRAHISVSGGLYFYALSPDFLSISLLRISQNLGP